VTGRALKAIPGGASRGLWAELWTRDTWWQLDLPNGDLSSTHRGERVISFQRIAQPWLKEAAKRWVRARVLAGTSISSLSSYMSDLSAFSEWLDAQRPDVSRPQALTRTVLEDYMLFIRTEPLKSSTRLRRIGTLRSLVEEQRKDGLRGRSTSPYSRSSSPRTTCRSSGRSGTGPPCSFSPSRACGSQAS
jgi:hypothetical protein